MKVWKEAILSKFCGVKLNTAFCHVTLNKDVSKNIICHWCSESFLWSFYCDQKVDSQTGIFAFRRDLSSNSITFLSPGVFAKLTNLEKLWVIDKIWIDQTVCMPLLLEDNRKKVPFLNVECSWWMCLAWPSLDWTPVDWHPPFLKTGE